MAVCWATVRLPGHGVVSALVVLALVVASVAYLWGRLEGGGEALRAGWPVALAALVAASLPFVVEGHFGILGTGFNPDMSQHLLATARLAEGHSSQLLHQGYPLGPHSVVVALNKGLGIGLVQGFSGLSVAVMVLAPLTALAAFRELAPLPRTAGALVVGLAYLVASYFAQGAFKETIEALLVLAFALALREATRAEWRELPLRFVPAALLAVGAVYAYSFPGLSGCRHLRHLGVRGSPSAVGRTAGPDRRSAGPCRRGLLLGAPRLRRPRRPRDRPHDRLPQLRNLRPQRPRPRQPLRPGLAAGGARDLALRRLPPRPRRRRRAGARLLPRRRLRPRPARLGGGALLAPPRGRGPRRASPPPPSPTSPPAPAAPPTPPPRRSRSPPRSPPSPSPSPCHRVAVPFGRSGRKRNHGPGRPSRGSNGRQVAKGTTRWGGGRWQALALAVYVAAAGVCSLLAFANAPVGPTSYSPALTGLRPLVAEDSTLVLASPTAARRRTRHAVHRLGAARRPRLHRRRRGSSTRRRAASASSSPRRRRRAAVPRPRVRRVAPPYVLWEAPARRRRTAPAR